MNSQCIEYLINKKNQLVWLDADWDDFALQNNAKELQADRVLNRYLFDFVSDNYCRHIYDMVIARVWQTKNTLTFPFRCDSPEKRRYMQMELTYVDIDSLRFRSCVSREVSRPPVLLLDRDTLRTDDVMVICSWCKKIKVSDETWLEVEDGIAQLGLFNDGPQRRLSHGMCPTCYETSMKELE